MRKVPTAVILLTLLMTGCQLQQQNKSVDETDKEAHVQPPLHLGAVHQVYPEQGFALLRMIGPVPRAGAILISHPADGSATRIGNLVVTSDQPAKNRIIAAEIRSGSPMQGDRVFMYRNIAQPVEKPEEEPAEISVPTATPGTPTPVMKPEVPAEFTPAEENIPFEETEEPKNNKATKQQETPKHILDIPDNIADWD